MANLKDKIYYAENPIQNQEYFEVSDVKEAMIEYEIYLRMSYDEGIKKYGHHSNEIQIFHKIFGNWLYKDTSN